MKNTRSLRIFLMAAVPLLTTQTASAHAKLLKSSPTANEIVTNAPTEVVLHFSEDLEISMSQVVVQDVTSQHVVSDEAITQESGDKASMKIALKQLPKLKATYEVSWKAVAKDAHKMPGHFKFTYSPKD